MTTGAAGPKTDQSTPPPAAVKSRCGTPQILLLITAVALIALAALEYFGVFGGGGGFGVLNIAAGTIGLALLIGVAIYACKKGEAPVPVAFVSFAADKDKIEGQERTIKTLTEETQQLQREKLDLTQAAARDKAAIARDAQTIASLTQDIQNAESAKRRLAVAIEAAHQKEAQITADYGSLRAELDAEKAKVTALMAKRDALKAKTAQPAGPGPAPAPAPAPAPGPGPAPAKPGAGGAAAPGGSSMGAVGDLTSLAPNAFNKENRAADLHAWE